MNLKELNEKYETYSELETQYEFEIKQFLYSLAPVEWRTDDERFETLFYFSKKDDASYRFEYSFGWKSIFVSIFHKKDNSPGDEMFLTPEEFSKFYKKLTVLDNFK